VNESFNAALKKAAPEEDAMPALEALHPDVGASSDYPPLVAAAGVFLLEADYVAQLYLHDHCFILPAKGG
jgi:hypothetical protein